MDSNVVSYSEFKEYQRLRNFIKEAVEEDSYLTLDEIFELYEKECESEINA